MRKRFFIRVALLLALGCAVSVEARAQFGIRRKTQAEAAIPAFPVKVDQFGFASLLPSKHEFVARDGERQGFNVAGFTNGDIYGFNVRSFEAEYLNNGRPVVDTSMGSAGASDHYRIRRSYDDAARKVTLTNAHLRVSGVFKDTNWSADGISVDITVENISKGSVVRGVDIQLATLRFPVQPQNFNGDARLHANRDAPSLIEAASADGQDDWSVLIENQTPDRAMIWGFPYSIDKPSNHTYPLVISTQQIGWLQEPHLLDPHIDRPLLPGASERIKLVLHFGTRAQMQERRKQVLVDYARQIPPLLEWDDRRPIGMAVLSTSSEAHHSATNPRGWFNDPKLNAFDAAEFRRRMIEYARSTVRVSKANDAQGVIVWDIEGQEFPHATSYIGDPRALPPEVEPVADEFFKTLRDGGLKIGLCIRPQRPVRAAYGGGVEQIEVADPAQVLADKIAYAKKRWGATMFYVDSNGDPNVPFDAKIFEQVLQAHPDVLLIPEHQSPRYYRFGAPYDELRGGVSGTPAHARELYPRSFTVINVADGDTKGKRAELVQAVKSGDVLMFRAWFDDTFNADVKSIYEEAKK